MLNTEMSPDRIGRKVMHHINESTGILSLSRTYKSLLMWSHYAESHKGFVIGFDDKHPFFHEKALKGLTNGLNAVIYSSLRPKIETNDKSKYHEILCCKSIDWSYEEEVRLFRLLSEDFETETTDQNNHKVYLYEIPSEAIQEIYLGANISEKTKSEIHLAIKRNHLNCDVYQMSNSDIDFQLETQKV